MNKRQHKINPVAPPIAESSDEDAINEMIQKRKLQQEALKKIMTSMDIPDQHSGMSKTRNDYQATARPGKKRK